jgi:DNA polymerase III gamma/tau subunit
MENEKQLEKTKDNKKRNSTLASKESEQPFHIKYRPKSFEEFLGNEPMVKSLKSLLEKKGHPHTYLFIGPSGTGKTTLARIIDKELGCHNTEFFELDTANTRGIDTIREVIESSLYVPTMGKVKVYLFDEAHQITGAAAEALLKLAEKPPRYVYLIFCTTNPEDMLGTLKNRCQIFSLNPLDEDTMRALVLHVLQEEKAELSPEILELLIKASDGIPRAALMLLQKIISLDKGEQERVLLDASPEVTSRDGIRDLCGILVRESSRTEQNTNWEDIRKILNRLNSPAEEIRKVIMEYMADFLLQATSEAEREKAIRIIDDFSKGSRNFDKASLVKICYQATHEFEDEGEDCSE